MKKVSIFALFSMVFMALLMVLPNISAQDATPTAQPSPTPPFGSKNIQLFVQFDQQFAGMVCPDGSPKAAFCLSVTGTTTSPTLGDLTLARTLVADRLKKDEFNRSSIVSSGTMTDADGDTLEFTMNGYLYSDGTADYSYLVTGGTGKFVGVKGHGAVLIPPPTSGSTGTEVWIGSLQLKVKRKK